MKKLFVISFLVLMHISCGFSTSKMYFKPAKFENNKDVIIYVYRGVEILGAITWGVYLDDNLVGNLRRNCYFDIHTSPGRHDLLFNNTGMKYRLTIDAEPNSVVVISLSMGQPFIIQENYAMAELSEKKYDKGL